jgi:hypothetical protein
MSPSIPATYFVNSTPSVLSAGGTNQTLNAVFITTDPSIPIGMVLAFSNYNAVAAWFGATAPETVLAGIYFSGFNGAQQLPTTLFFVQFNAGSVHGYLRGGSVSGFNLAQIQAFSGVIDVVVDGTPITTSTISLAAATSFSNAASIITSALGAAATCTYDSLRQAFVITSASAGASSSVANPTDTSLSPLLLLTQATGAVISPGAVAQTQAGMMNVVTSQTTNWCPFMTVAEVTLSAKLNYANWLQLQNQQFMYVCQDSNAAVLSQGASAAFGPLVAAYNGVVPVYDVPAAGTQPGQVAAFICGITASIDFFEMNGYVDYAFKSNGALVPQITSATQAAALQSNGYSFYANVATQASQFQFLYAGGITGQWEWIDEYVAQIYFNSSLVEAGISLMTQVKSLPNNPRGDNLIRAAMLDPIGAAVNFGTIQNGVELSNAQIAELATAAGVDISTPLLQQGWYLQVVPATAIVRANRGPRQVNIFYTNGGSVHTLNLSSTFVQ